MGEYRLSQSAEDDLIAMPNTAMNTSGLRSPIDIVTISNNVFQYWQSNRSYIQRLTIFDLAITAACAARIRSTTAQGIGAGVE